MVMSFGFADANMAEEQEEDALHFHPPLFPNNAHVLHKALPISHYSFFISII